jgi:hypothetical protein
VRPVLAGFLDALVIADPAEYRREPDERPGQLRNLAFGPHGQGLVTFLVYPPDELVLIVRVQWLGG